MYVVIFAPIALSVVVLSLMGYEMYKDYKELKDYKEGK